MLSHVQIKVKKTSVIKEYLNFLRAFAGNVCSEFEGKKYHQILVIYHARRLQDSDSIQSERWSQGKLFCRTYIEILNQNSGIKIMIDVKNCDGGKKISKIDNRKVHTLKALTKVKNKIRQSSLARALSTTQMVKYYEKKYQK